jgi:RimJ/RimL family protein N-acetyltransferase
LRQFSKEDYNDLYAFLSERKDDEFESYPTITYENGNEHLKYRLNNDEFIALELKETHKVIGNIYLGKRQFNSLELGFIIKKSYQRQGLAYEAASFLIEKAFAEGIHRIYGECNPRNTASWGLMERLGLTREGALHQNVSFKNDKEGHPVYEDTLIYAKLNPSGR